MIIKKLAKRPFTDFRPGDEIEVSPMDTFCEDACGHRIPMGTIEGCFRVIEVFEDRMKVEPIEVTER